MIKSEYEAHPVWQSIENIEKALDGFSENAKGDARHEDLAKKSSYLKWMLTHSEPFLFSAGELNQINSQLQQIINHIPNNANNWGHFPQIEGFFTQAFNVASYARVPKVFRSDANSFFEECESKVDSLKTKSDTELTTVKKHAEKLDEALGQAMKEAETLNKALQDSNDAIEAQFDNWETQIDTDIKEKFGELAETFSEGQTKRREDHEAMLNKIADLLREAQSNTDKTLSVNKKLVQDTKKELEEEFKKAVEDADEILLKMRNLYGIAGDTALAGDFIKTAKSEGVSYIVFTIVASIFYIAIPASFLYLWVNYIDASEFRITDLLVRLPISAVFLAPAIYFGNLAQKHRRVSVSLRSLGIRIAAFDAYLANFSDADKNVEKQKMTEVFFDAKISSDRTPSTSNKDLGKALDQLVIPLEKLYGVFGGKNG